MWALSCKQASSLRVEGAAPYRCNVYPRLITNQSYEVFQDVEAWQAIPLTNNGRLFLNVCLYAWYRFQALPKQCSSLPCLSAAVSHCGCPRPVQMLFQERFCVKGGTGMQINSLHLKPEHSKPAIRMINKALLQSSSVFSDSYYP